MSFWEWLLIIDYWSRPVKAVIENVKNTRKTKILAEWSKHSQKLGIDLALVGRQCIFGQGKLAMVLVTPAMSLKAWTQWHTRRLLFGTLYWTGAKGPPEKKEKRPKGGRVGSRNSTGRTSRRTTKGTRDRKVMREGGDVINEFLEGFLPITPALSLKAWTQWPHEHTLVWNSLLNGCRGSVRKRGEKTPKQESQTTGGEEGTVAEGGWVSTTTTGTATLH